jgi:hypothetical protein
MEDRIPPAPRTEPTPRVRKLMRKAAKLRMTLSREDRRWCLAENGKPVWHSTRLDDVEKYLDDAYFRAFARE